jgi:hypothetical protein
MRADDGGCAFVRNLPADCSRQVRFGLLRLGRRLGLSERKRWNGAKRNEHQGKGQEAKQRASAAAATGGVCAQAQAREFHHSNLIAFRPALSNV